MKVVLQNKIKPFEQLKLCIGNRVTYNVNTILAVVLKPEKIKSDKYVRSFKGLD